MTTVDGIACTSYRDHQSAHRFGAAGWTCDRCRPIPEEPLGADVSRLVAILAARPDHWHTREELGRATGWPYTRLATGIDYLAGLRRIHERARDKRREWRA